MFPEIVNGLSMEREVSLHLLQNTAFNYSIELLRFPPHAERNILTSRGQTVSTPLVSICLKGLTREGKALANSEVSKGYYLNILLAKKKSAHRSGMKVGEEVAVGMLSFMKGVGGVAYAGPAPCCILFISSSSCIESSVNFLPIRSWMSKYLATQRSRHTDSPLDSSASL